MQRCAICEKPLYGHPDAKGKPLVCGSCPLQKVKGGKSGKGEFEVRQNMLKVLKQETRTTQEEPMSALVVKSNFARNKTILLDGRYPIVFDAHGEARMPAHLRAALEVEMRNKPGRFWVVEEVAPAEVEPVAVIPAVVEEVTVAKVEDAPAKMDLDYLREEKKEAPVKAAKKK